MRDTPEREYCPRCNARVRSLQLADDLVRHHQCTDCGYRYENVSDGEFDEDGEFDGLIGIDALPEDDRDAMEGQVFLIVGNGTMIGGIELTSRTIADLVGEHGAPQSVLRSFTWPTHQWLLRRARRFSSYYVAIDQGRWRVCFTIRRLSPVALR
ncbi:hypothetical protein [Lysobacter auxotrophicus]|uniref:YheV family putative metal-binding protein n=1 Tax=Lysobacter auxotrophicus TaxID=2992573 RepID=A0ABN6ULY5_9GAMM|nr:hypothetical protein [Lysobacter auxotrophicus]BDU17394.1 YheV family putative metal-binding protein [Lysobacter auxotrophicus]